MNEQSTLLANQYAESWRWYVFGTSLLFGVVLPSIIENKRERNIVLVTMAVASIGLMLYGYESGNDAMQHLGAGFLVGVSLRKGQDILADDGQEDE